MISVEGLSVEFNATPLFADVSYVINKKDRIALVGKNGAGKSTMLKILAGLQNPTRGVVAVPKDVTIGYLPQVMILSDVRTVMEEAELAFEHIFELQANLERMNQQLADRTDYESEEYHQLIDRFTHENDRFLMMGGTNFQAEIERTLLGLGFSREDFNRSTSEFSGGWRMRIELAKLLLRRLDVLLLFILIMCVTLFQAQKSYNESIKERDDKIALQEQYTAEILAQQSELDEKNSKLSSQDEQLDKQKKLLAELAAQLKEQQASLDEKTSLLATQQKKIDNIIAVKADVIEALQKEFSKNNVSVDIDTQTGALTLNANVLFDYDKSELTDEGKQELADILPIYCKVLLQKDYKKYLAEIIIDGYTDTDGDYDYNLELSQKRSLAVAQYLTEIRENFLSSDEISELQNYLTVNGHGSANPVLDSDGNVDKDASRRVEVKFRLKDDEMINELNQIMNTDKTSDSEKSGSN